MSNIDLVMYRVVNNILPCNLVRYLTFCYKVHTNLSKENFASLKFIYSEKAIRFWKITTVDLTGTTNDKSSVEISQNFVAFSEYINFQGAKFSLAKSERQIADQITE